MPDQLPPLERLRKVNTLRDRNILTTTECAFQFIDIVGDAPGHTADLFRQLDTDVAEYVAQVIARGAQDYYAGRFSILSNPPTPFVDRVVVSSDNPPEILCYRRGSDTPFQVEPQHPFRLAFESLTSFLAARQPT